MPTAPRRSSHLDLSLSPHLPEQETDHDRLVLDLDVSGSFRSSVPQDEANQAGPSSGAYPNSNEHARRASRDDIGTPPSDLFPSSPIASSSRIEGPPTTGTSPPLDGNSAMSASTSSPGPASDPATESQRSSSPVAGPSRRLGPSRSSTPQYDLVPVSYSPMSPVKRISLSQNTTVACQRMVDKVPSQVFVAVPANVKPEVQTVGDLHNRAYVVLRMSRKTRDTLIARGVYNPFRDDWEPPASGQKRPRAGFLEAAQIRGSKGTGAVRARPPERVPDRFPVRHGPPLLEPWASVLTEESLLNRLGQHECGWKGCGSVLNSEANLAKHVRIREHAMDGVFTVGSWGQVVLYQCLWRGCDEPCFDSVQNLLQHMTAIHISKVLQCPYARCTLHSHTISHLQRHVMKHHDEDSPRPRVDRPWRPLLPVLPPLPKTIHLEDLVTQPVRAEPARTNARSEWVRKKVEKYSFAPPTPEIHIVHPPHMLEQIDPSSGTATPTTAIGSDDGSAVSESAPGKLGPGPGRRKKRKAIFRHLDNERTAPRAQRRVVTKSKLTNVFTAPVDDDDYVDDYGSPSVESGKVGGGGVYVEIPQTPRRSARGSVNRAFVELPFVQPYRAPGEPVVFHHSPYAPGHEPEYEDGHGHEEEGKDEVELEEDGDEDDDEDENSGEEDEEHGWARGVGSSALPVARSLGSEDEDEDPLFLRAGLSSSDDDDD